MSLNPTASVNTGNHHGVNRSASQGGLEKRTSTPIANLLRRLENVRRHGKGWTANCPAHESESRSSLAIAEGDDGRVLLHCFGGCGALEVVHALGLELADLYPTRLTHTSTSAEWRALRQLAKQAQWAAALDVLAFEARVVHVGAQQIKQGQPLGAADSQRFLLAMERIEGARRVFRGR